LQVLRPERADNYYEQFDIVPVKYRPLLQAGKVLVTNWHRFAPESEHVENGKAYAVVNKGQETPDTFARRVLEDLYERLPITVLNDEGHHCWRPAPEPEDLTGAEKKEADEEREEARIWLDGLDRINNCTPDPAKQVGISVCVDMSATPFHIHGSGYPVGRPFPWIVTDFGLVDAIESGIVKIPRLPVQDTTGRPDPKYFKLWKAINENLQPAERLPGKGGRPKPDVVYRERCGSLFSASTYPCANEMRRSAAIRLAIGVQLSFRADARVRAGVRLCGGCELRITAADCALRFGTRQSRGRHALRNEPVKNV
jgi:type III restriction enzyme